MTNKQHQDDQPQHDTPDTDPIDLSWNQHDEVDEDLVEMAVDQSGGSVLRPLLMIIVLVMGGWVIAERRADLEYFFNSQEAVDVGNVMQFAEKVAKDPGYVPEIPHNAYVSLEGIPSKRSTNDRFRYMKLVGAQVYVELPREDADKSELEKMVKGKAQADRDRSYFTGKGRALKLSQVPHRYRNLRMYYARHYNTSFCVDLTSEQIQERKKKVKDAVLKAQAEGTLDVLKDVPAQDHQAELDKLLREPVCAEAFVIQAQSGPRSHWWYVLLCLIIGAFMIIDTWFLIKWVRNFLKPDDL